MILEKYSIGVGDRFGHQAEAQLKALMAAEAEGVSVVPVWNKSKREHTLIGSSPAQTRVCAEAAIKELGWKKSFYVDADHIELKTVNDFITYCDFYTIDVAEHIGRTPEKSDKDEFIAKASAYLGTLTIPNVSGSFNITDKKLNEIADKYLAPIKEASRIYKHIESVKGAENFITEVSLDENDLPQTPEELFFILFGMSLDKIPIQTIAPKFTGRFNKGIDYVGDIKKFTQEFEDDLAVIEYAKKNFNLPSSLKLSIHSGSDKFSLYAPIYNALKKYDAGVHLKTAGTTWLEELIGLSESGGEGLNIAKEIYSLAMERKDELSKPYATVIDIDNSKLPSPKEVNGWTSAQFVNALRHDQKNKEYNIHFRQLLHISFKLAAEMGTRYTDALKNNSDVIARNVKENLFDRHIRPLFLGRN